MADSQRGEEPGRRRATARAAAIARAAGVMRGARRAVRGRAAARLVVSAVTWLTVLALVPIPWGAVAEWAAPADWLPTVRSLGDALGVAWAEENSIPPSQRRGVGANGVPSSAFPPEDVVLQRAGAAALATPEARIPVIDFDESPTRGPGLAVRQAIPGEPLQNVDLRLRGVGGRRPQKSGRLTTFQVPKDGVGALPLAGPLGPAPVLPRIGGPDPGQQPVAAPTVAPAATGGVVTPTAIPTAAASPAPLGSAPGGARAIVDFLWRLVAPGTAHAQLFGTPFPTAGATAVASPMATPTPTPTSHPRATATASVTPPVAAGAAAAVPATVTSGARAAAAASTATSTATPTPTATSTATRAATVTPAATPAVTPTASGTPTPTAAPVTTASASPPTLASPPALVGTGNAYGARMELVYEQAADGMSVKETILLHDRPATNVLTYDFRVDGLKVVPQPDGSLFLLDHADHHTFTIPAPTFRDAAGRSGAASYRLAPGQLDIVLEPALLAGGTLPFEVDPTLVLIPGSNQYQYAGAPWQRRAFTARDGTQALLVYDQAAGSSGIRIKSSANYFASLLQDQLLIAGFGSAGFSAEIDSETDTVYVAVTYLGPQSEGRLGVYQLPYNPATKTWSVGTSSLVMNDPSGLMSGPSVAIGRDPSNVGHIWVGVQRQSGVGGSYLFDIFHAPLSVFGGSGSWSGARPPFDQTIPSPSGSVIATQQGVMAIARDTYGLSSSVLAYGAGATWSAKVRFEPGGNFGPDGAGKLYAAVNIIDPAHPLTHWTLVAFAPMNYANPTQSPMRLYYRADTDVTGAWTVLEAGTAVTDTYPQLSWDGTSFYLFRRAWLATYDWQLAGQRGTIGLSGALAMTEADRVWVKDAATADRNIDSFEVPRRIGAEAIPFFYVRRRIGGTDDIAVQSERIDVLGDRPGWDYREFVMPGAGTMKVNLANGNLHYRMTDSFFPSRVWNDEIVRAYDSRATEPDVGYHLFGAGWSASFQPRIEVTADPNRVKYWPGDGTRYTYLKSGNDWIPELGMYAELTRPATSFAKTWSLKDVYGNIIEFDGNGRPTRKADTKATPSVLNWDNANPGGRVSTLYGSTNRPTRFVLDASFHVTQIRVEDPAGDQFRSTYGYDGSGRLTSATLAGNTAEFAEGDPARRVRVTYGYDANGRLSQITTPEGNVYQIGYDGYGRVAWVDLPDPATGAPSTCGRPTHCWEFAYASGQGRTTVTDPAGTTWNTLAYGSGQVYEVWDGPVGGSPVSRRFWSVNRNLTADYDQLGNVTRFAYDSKGNRTKIEDPVNGATKPTLFGYDAQSRRISRTDPRGNLTAYQYNPDGLLWKETDPEGGVAEFLYDTDGNLTQNKNPRGQVTAFTYDGRG